MTLPIPVSEWLGFNWLGLNWGDPTDSKGVSLTSYNDDHTPFESIASIIEDEWGPKVE